MPISDFMATDVATAAPDTPVEVVAGAMRDCDADYVAILEEERPVGLLTAADIGRAYVAGELDDRLAGDVAGDPPQVRESADLSRLVAAFADTDSQYAVVVDDGGAFVGVTTMDHALIQYGRDLERVLAILE